MNSRRTFAVSLLAASLALAIFSAAQDSPGKKLPSVYMAPVPLSNITRGKPGTVELQFRISSGFHINSNTPRSEFLIPTVLKLNPPTDIAIAKVSYPRGEEMSFPFAPDEKLSVYSGDFALDVQVRPLHTVMPGKYMVRGALKYQACDNLACYPPRQLPVQFEVKVVKSPPAPVVRRNPGQSPHAHR